MTTTRKQQLISGVVMLFMLGIGVSESAWAHGERGGGGSRGFSGGILQELIFPCQAECRNSARDCVDPLESTAVSCIQSTCATQVSAAQTACATDRTAQACKDAVSALRTCGDTCITTLQTGVTACRETEQSCREACDLAQ